MRIRYHRRDPIHTFLIYQRLNIRLTVTALAIWLTINEVTDRVLTVLLPVVFLSPPTTESLDQATYSSLSVPVIAAFLNFSGIGERETFDAFSEWKLHHTFSNVAGLLRKAISSFDSNCLALNWIVESSTWLSSVKPRRTTIPICTVA